MLILVVKKLFLMVEKLFLFRKAIAIGRKRWKKRNRNHRNHVEFAVTHHGTNRFVPEAVFFSQTELQVGPVR